MNVQIHRLDPNVPDPVESRRAGAGRLVRFVYALGVLVVVGFFALRLGTPLLFLGGSGIVSAPREAIALPYVVQVQRMDVKPGSKVDAGAPVAFVRSYQVDEIIANLMRAYADVLGRRTELDIKAKIARESLDAAKSRLKIAGEAVQRLQDRNSGDSVSFTYRTEVYREQALAVQNVAALEAEAAGAEARLPYLIESQEKITAELERVRREFDEGRVYAPVTGVIAAHTARPGETVLAGSSIAEVFLTDDIYIDWYIPDWRLVEPMPGQKVIVVVGAFRAFGTIQEILPLSVAVDSRRSALLGERQSQQVARVRLDPGHEPPALDSKVYIHMYYSHVLDHIMRVVIRILGVG